MCHLSSIAFRPMTFCRKILKGDETLFLFDMVLWKETVPTEHSSALFQTDQDGKISAGSLLFSMIMQLSDGTGNVPDFKKIADLKGIQFGSRSSTKLEIFIASSNISLETERSLQTQCWLRNNLERKRCPGP